MSGVSFFQNRLIAQRRQFIVDANEEVETRQEAEGKDIDPSVENGGFGYKYTSSIWLTNTIYVESKRSMFRSIQTRSS